MADAAGAVAAGGDARRIHVPLRVRFSDLDAYGHVNNVAMLRFLEEARARAFWAGDATHDADFVDEFAETAVLASKPGESTLTLIAHQEIEYLLPIPYFKSPIDIQMWPSRLGGASIVLCYEVHGPGGVDGAALFARAATTLVLVDAVTMKPRRISSAERAAWDPYLGGPIVFGRHSAG